MSQYYVVETNVLIGASAGPEKENVTPQDPTLRQRIFNWLVSFNNSSSNMVLDQKQYIEQEYRTNLSPNDYGYQVLIHKYSVSQVVFVPVEYDGDGYAVLPSNLMEVVHDRSDRKMVAAALLSKEHYSEGRIAFAADSDWHAWEDALTATGLILEPIIGEWTRQKHMDKQKNKT